MADKIIINIGRQLGSGGREIGEKLAKRFDAHYYDKALVAEAARESGLDENAILRSDERKSLFQSLFSMGASVVCGAEFYGRHFGEDAVFQIVSDVIRRAAERESCVFVGRCADYVLRDNPACINVFVSADMDDRVKRLSSKFGVDADKARQMAEQMDEKRASFYNFYSNNRWGEASTYHLCVNSSVLGIDGTVDFIASFVEKRNSL